MLTSIEGLIQRVNGWLWGPWQTPLGQIPGFLILVLFGVGIYLSLRLRFVQLRHLGRATRSIFGRGSEGSGGVLSPFQAFATALAATIGTGNIAGVATAIVSGGPGALFWIWCYGLFAAGIKFAEAVLGVTYRVGDPGRFAAGPPYYLRDGLGWPRVAALYALLAGIGVLTTTPLMQPNSIAVVMESKLHIPPLATGLVVAALTWLVIIGGIQSIGRAVEKLAPLKVILYLGGGLVVILSNLGSLPEVLSLIFREAFSFKAAAGGGAGIGIMMALRYGVARGVYANEAGYGTAAAAFGTAKSGEPAEQGLHAALEVFIISFLTSSISGLVILLTGVWKLGQTSTAVVAQAFDTAFPGGGYLVALCTFLFGYTTLIGWSYYGEQFLGYLFGPRIIAPFRWIYCGLITVGAVAKVDLVWAWGDLMNGLQIIPNLLGVVALGAVVVKASERLRART